jgi:two-component system, sensor histidine kinase and response regulator
VSEDGAAAILLVDDSEANRVAIASLLETLQRPVVAVASGAEALAYLDAHEVALIVLDVQMPGLDGFQTLVRIRERRHCTAIPVVFMTAVYDDAAHEAHGYALGAVDYVSKPFNQTVVVAKLRALLEMHERSEQLHRESEELATERAIRGERERILGIVTHDLRSPLATIRTGSDFLIARAQLDEPEAKIVRRIQRNADRMARLVNDLLDFTRLQNGPLPIRPAPAILAEVVVESVEDIQHAHPRRIELSVETRRPAKIDEDRVAQAVSNLVLNALQHSPDNGRVAVVLRDHDDALELSVWNEGEIKAIDATRLFEPFRRGAGSQGMGLGLYISQEIARAHGGEITVSSSPETGTTFRLVLPAGN